MRAQIGGLLFTYSMPKPLGSRNFSQEEGERLAELAARGLRKTEAAKAMGRSAWTIKRHSRKLGIVFAPRQTNRAVSRQVARPDLTATRARLRQLEDRLIRELALHGWTQGAAALELDLADTTMWKHSKRLGVSWTRYNRSVRGTRVAGLAELRRLRAIVAKRGRLAGR
jgi:transposase